MARKLITADITFRMQLAVGKLVFQSIKSIMLTGEVLAISSLGQGCASGPKPAAPAPVSCMIVCQTCPQ